MKIFDLHCDTIGECYKQGKSLRENNMHLDLERCSKYDLYTQVFAVWIPDELRGEQASEYFESVADLFYKELEDNNDLVSLYRDSRKTPVKAILSVEGGSACAGTEKGLLRLYERGVSLITLTWNGENEIGSGAFSEGGLTEFGKRFIRLCDELGIVLDVSHLNRQGFTELVELYKGKFIASHSNADIVDNFYAHHRNLSLWQIEEIKKRKGLIGLNFCSDFIDSDGAEGVASLKKQLELFCEQGCEDIIALGSDYDGCTMHDDFCGVEKLSDVYNKLLDDGFSKELMNKLFYENAQRFFSE